jgi:type I restriction enzyme S subunit
MVSKDEIPEHWGWKKLEDIGEIYSGGTPDRDNESYFGGEIPWLRLKDAKDFYVSSAKENITEKGLNNSSAQLLPEGTVIVSTRATIGRVTIAETEVATNQGFKSVYTEECVPEFVAYYMNSIEDELNQKGRTTTYPEVNKTQFKNTEIPVPPLEEQKIIVEKLEEIFDRIENIQEAQEQAKEIQDRLESIIASDIFRELNEETVKLNEVTSKITDGSHQTPDYTEDGVYFLRAGDIKGHKIDWDDLKNVTEEEHNRLSSRWPEKGDVLYTKNGTIGIAKAVDWEKEASIYVSLALIRPNEGLDTHYLEKFLNTDLALQQAKDRTKTVSVSNLHLEEIREMEIPFPSMEKQKAIVDIIEKSHQKIRDSKDLLNKREEIIEDLPQSVLVEAFKGNLVSFILEADSSSSNNMDDIEAEIETEGQQKLGEFD